VTTELGLIAKYFSRPAKRALLGVGDDCALLPGSSACTAISTDTLVEGIHFFADVDPKTLGHKALAVNLSDLAAMGATPRFFTLALTLPRVDDDWLSQFSAGLFALADQFQIELVGGDTTRGPLSITITVLGELKTDNALRRDGAKAGDDVWVSGRLGGAALALRQLLSQGTRAAIDTDLRTRLEAPQPRIALGKRLGALAHSAIDISDGLLADLNHVATRSSLGANIDWSSLPIHPALQSEALALRQMCALTGGDDYELCFTAATPQRDNITRLGEELGLPLTRIGTMTAGPIQVRVLDRAGDELKQSATGFDHFSRQF
jgi:thiamine-monophosphate kinase